MLLVGFKTLRSLSWPSPQILSFPLKKYCCLSTCCIPHPPTPCSIAVCSRYIVIDCQSSLIIVMRYKLPPSVLASFLTHPLLVVLQSEVHLSSSGVGLTYHHYQSELWYYYILVIYSYCCYQNQVSGNDLLPFLTNSVLYVVQSTCIVVNFVHCYHQVYIILFIGTCLIPYPLHLVLLSKEMSKYGLMSMLPEPNFL
ncbi:hypothetical protein F5J12DRAFT_786308 [Pisolithus orientalis]|uniref:uncharacterized protein n=1 Tax=Pisolithus orientalis TaxID=936130 RepID=UPI00222558EF|nr:uncharacterized protein F5J12DRAFT_786308 [Pisolithus orientalis]KAI5991764.1 hypothetical protein F5J12DRAFT_786308 [Pisolithus orientalis]